MSFCKGMEHDHIILTTERSPMSGLPIGHDSLPDSLCGLYVMATAKHFNLVIISSMNF